MANLSWLVKIGVLKPDAEALTSMESVVEEDSPKPTPRKKDKTVAEPEPTAEAIPQDSSEMVINCRKMMIEEMATAAVNRTGFSYWSFRELLNKLSKKIKDEAALYAAVCATASTMQANGDNLAESAKSFIKVLDKEQEEFADSLEESKKAMGAKRAELSRLNKQIKDLLSQKDALEVKIEELKHGIDFGNQAFAQAHDELVAQIKEHVAKIKQYSE